MNCKPPASVQLTEQEAALLAQIPQEPKHDGKWKTVEAALEKLTLALLDRDAIPNVRLKLFSDPSYAETGRRSHKEVFEKNGTTGDDIIKHPNFIKYLYFFIHGPSLPDEVASGLCEILSHHIHTSSALMEARQFARDCMREYRLEPEDAGTQFFRLAVELGFSASEARSIRDAAKSVRRR